MAFPGAPLNAKSLCAYMHGVRDIMCWNKYMVYPFMMMSSSSSLVLSARRFDQIGDHVRECCLFSVVPDMT